MLLYTGWLASRTRGPEVRRHWYLAKARERARQAKQARAAAKAKEQEEFQKFKPDALKPAPEAEPVPDAQDEEI